MPVEIKSFGEIINGEFKHRSKARFRQQLKDAGNVNQALMTITGANMRTLDQNAYAWVVCSAIATRMNQDGWNYTPDHIYRHIEDTHCWEHLTNSETGKTRKVLTPLKKQPTDKFHDIIEQVRVGHMQNYPDNYIATPAQHYGLTEDAYELWRMGTITFAQAKNRSNKTQSQ